MKADQAGLTPYVGPRPFERNEEDQGRFFGRDQETEEIVSLIFGHPVVLVYAQSGAGKTSLFNARIAPALENSGFDFLRLSRVRGAIPEGIVPESIVNLYVFNALLHLEPEADPRALVDKSLAAFLEECPRPIDRNRRPVPRVIVFDQFEELFTLYPQRWREQREDFFRQVAEAVGADPLLRCVFVLREDHLASLDPFARLLPEELRPRFRMERLGREAALESVRGPLKDTGRSFADGVAEQLVAELLEVRVQTSRGEIAQVQGEFVEPVQLQVVCRSLWQGLPPDAAIITADYLEAFGDVDQALSGFYERSVEEAAQGTGVKDRGLRTWFEDTLVTPAGTRGTVYRGQETTGGIPNVAVDVLENLHLIRGEWRAGARWYELTHDRFIEPIQKSNEAWRAARRQGRLRIGGAVVVLLLVIAAVAAGMQRLAADARAARAVAVARSTAEAESEAMARATGVAVRSTADAAAYAARATAEAERDRADENAGIAASQSLALQSLAYVEDMLDLALLLGLEAFQMEESVETRSSLLTSLEHNPRLASFLWGHTSPVTSPVRAVAFSPDGRTLASGNGNGVVVLWDMMTRQPRGEFLAGHEGAVLTVAFNAGGSVVASGGEDGTIILWDASTNERLGEALTSFGAAVNSVAFSPDGQILAAGNGDGTLILWDVQEREPLSGPLTDVNTHSVHSIAFSPDGTILASAGGDNPVAARDLVNVVVLWDVAERRPVGTLVGHQDPVRAVVFARDGRRLASGSEDGTVILWDLETRQPVETIRSDLPSAAGSLAFSPDGQRLAVASCGRLSAAAGCTRGKVLLWDVEEGWLHDEHLIGHEGAVLGVAFSPDGQSLASAGEDGTTILWNMGRRQGLAWSLAGEETRVRDVAFDKNGRLLASGGCAATEERSRSCSRGEIRLWDVVTGEATDEPLLGHSDWVNDVAFSPDREMLASGSEDGTIILWDTVTRAPIGAPLVGHNGPVNAVDFGIRGELIASASDDGRVILWDVATTKPLGEPLIGHSDSVHDLAFSPDGSLLASGGGDDTVLLWDVATHRRLGDPLNNGSYALSLAFRPDGTALAAGNRDHTIKLWDVASRGLVDQPLTDHRQPVLSLAFSPDGRMFASGSFDATVILWDAATRQRLGQPLAGRQASLSSVAFNPASTLLASSSQDGGIVLWDVNPASWQALACRMANRNLTRAEWERFMGADTLYERTCPGLPPGQGVSPPSGVAGPTSTPVPGPAATVTLRPTSTSVPPTPMPTPAPTLTPTPTPTATPTPTPTPTETSGPPAPAPEPAETTPPSSPLEAPTAPP